MYHFNKIIGFLITPAGVAALLLIVGLVLNWLRRRGKTWARGGWWWVTGSAVWLWAWSTPLMGYFVGASLEREFLVDGKVPCAENYSSAAAILLLGGGMGVEESLDDHAEMWMSADRVWRAAELYKAGKASKIYATGGHVERSTGKLLADFGVPREAIVFDESPRNTEEEAKRLAEVLGKMNTEPNHKTKVLLVTSAWHMKRARLMFEKYAPDLEAIPAPRDFENTMKTKDAWGIIGILPNTESLMWNSVTFHEWLGIFGYRYFR